MSGWRHRGNLPGVQDVRAGGSRPRTAGRHIDQHRNLAGQHTGDDLPHRIGQPARGIQAQHDRHRAVGHSMFRGVVEIFSRRRADRTIQRQLRHHGSRCQVIGDRWRLSGAHHTCRHHAKGRGPRHPQPTRHHGDLRITSASRRIEYASPNRTIRMVELSGVGSMRGCVLMASSLSHGGPSIIHPIVFVAARSMLDAWSITQKEAKRGYETDLAQGARHVGKMGQFLVLERRVS